MLVSSVAERCAVENEIAQTRLPSPLECEENRWAIVCLALEKGLEISISNSRLKLFKSGDTVRTPSGYFQLDEEVLMCSVTQRGQQACVYVRDDGLWLWLKAQTMAMSDEALSRIAAAGQISFHPSARINDLSKPQSVKSNVFSIKTNDHR